MVLTAEGHPCRCFVLTKVEAVSLTALPSLRVPGVLSTDQEKGYRLKDSLDRPKLARTQKV